MKKIFAINGSASNQSANQKILESFAKLTEAHFTVHIFNLLKKLPHFEPELSVQNPPAEIIAFRTEIEHADGILICSPEYVFSIPSGLKNALEWCVATNVFADKPLGIITASAQGEKCHIELQLIMKTLATVFTNETTLLIQGVKGKVNEHGDITDSKTLKELNNLMEAYKKLVLT